MGIMATRLGVLLAVGPTARGFEEAYQQMHEALRNGQSVYLYAVDDGVLGLSKFEEFKRLGLHCYGCAFSARQRELVFEESTIFCGLSILADLWANAELLMSATERGGCSDVILIKQEDGSKRKILLEVASNPRVGGQANEAIRIAAGVQVWHRVEMSLLFRGDGLFCLDENFLLDNEVMKKELALLKNEGAPFLADAAAELKTRNVMPAFSFESLSTREVETIKQQMSWSIVF